MSTNSRDLLTKALENLKTREIEFQTQKAKIERLQAELVAKSSEIEDLKQALNQQAAQIQRLKAELSTKNREIHQLQSSGSSDRNPHPTAIGLKSAWGIDYSHLQTLLSQQQWQSANEETAKKMLEVMGRSQVGYLREEDIHRFPCEDLMILNGLWVHASQNRFGFSVQKHIYESLEGERKKIDYSQFKALVSRLGWTGADRKEWVGAQIFDLSAPPGHFPEISSHVNWKDAQFPLTKVIIRLRGYRALFDLIKKCDAHQDNSK